VPPQRDLAEDPAHGSRLVAPTQIREDVDGIVSRVETALARRCRNRVRSDRQRERILVTAAGSDGGLTRRPDEVVQD
jgi:hypothetical protein